VGPASGPKPNPFAGWARVGLWALWALRKSTEDNIEEGVQDTLFIVQPTTQNKQVKRKHSQQTTSEALDDTELLIEESAQARLVRIRKKPRLLDGFEIDKL
jgi:hypothetical protein